MRQIKQFTVDMVATFFYFAATPVQYVFWKMPRLYECVLTVIIFFKNLIPTRTELHYTWLHWQIAVISAFCSACRYISLKTCTWAQYILHHKTNLLMEYEHTASKLKL